MSQAATLRAFVGELVAAGVRDAIVCPGSRSTPLALALRTTPGIRVRVLLDERSAAFFALGLARTDRRPVVVLATSGTAAVEFGPAVVEANGDWDPDVTQLAPDRGLLGTALGTYLARRDAVRMIGLGLGRWRCAVPKGCGGWGIRFRA